MALLSHNFEFSTQCIINKDELRLKKLQEANLLLFGGPRAPFTAQELQDITMYVETGGSVLIIMAEGGE